MPLFAKKSKTAKKQPEFFVDDTLPKISTYRFDNERFLPIPEIFEKRNITHELLDKQEVSFVHDGETLISHVYLYVRYHNDTEETMCYEVFISRFSRATEMKAGGEIIKMQPKELYPSDESFGSTAWCYSGKDAGFSKAEKKFESLVSLDF